MTAVRRLSRQRGVAVVTALLLTTLAITIVASLFWQQQVQVRSIENQRLQLQKQWILRGALDWTRLILREDARYSPGGVDHLGEPWATPLAETRLDQYVENARADTDVPDAVLSGGVIDAQSRFNLTNLCQNGVVKPVEVEAFEKLLTNLRQNPALARATATLMQTAQAEKLAAANASASQAGAVATGAAAATAAAPQATSTASNTSSSSAPLPVDILYPDDLLAVPGFTPEVLDAIRDYVVVLPQPTSINVNTASAEVIAARIATLSLAEAGALVSARDPVWFKSPADFQTRASQITGKNISAGQDQINVSTGFFLVNGNVRLNRATMRMQALIQRDKGGPFTTTVRWIRES